VEAFTISDFSFLIGHLSRVTALKMTGEEM
jgi:hypothetical protein